MAAIIGATVLLIGVLFCAACAMFWNGRPYLHAGPFVYGWLFYLLPDSMVGPFSHNWQAAAVLGVSLYVLTWLGIWADRYRERPPS